MLLIHWSLVWHTTNSLFTDTQNGSVPVWTCSLSSGTFPSRTVPRGTVPHKRDGPDRYRTVPVVSINNSVPLASSSTIIFGLFVDVRDVFLLHVFSFSTFFVNDREAAIISVLIRALQLQKKQSLGLLHNT